MDDPVEHRLQRALAFSTDREGIEPLPFLVHIIRGFVRAEETLDLRPIITSVEREPTITARVIAHAQSAAFHGAAPVMSVGDAINRLGLNDARRVILALAMARSFDFSRCPAFDLKRYLIGAIGTGYGASCVGDLVLDMGAPRIDTAGWYSIGLLHSIGLLYLVEREPAAMGHLLSAPANQTNQRLLEAQQDLFGFDQYDLSAVLLAVWGLPAPFHVALPYLNRPSYKGDLWWVAAVIDLARSLSPPPTDTFIDDRAGQWGLRLSGSPSLGIDGMDEALSLVNVVL